MSHTLIVHFDRLPDLRLVRQLLDRLGVRYERSEEPPKEKETTSWLDGLGLPAKPMPMSYQEHLASELTVSPMPERVEDPPYGAWEDEEESLEELLEMLTP